jgi:peroxidase
MFLKHSFFICFYFFLNNNFNHASLLQNKGTSYLIKCSHVIDNSIQCDPSNKFRTLDGSCNNLKLFWLGKTDTPFKRYFGNAYNNKIDEPRLLNKNGNMLPNPRIISLKLFTDKKKLDNRISHITAFFGQFLAHDITSTPIVCILKFKIFLHI